MVDCKGCCIILFKIFVFLILLGPLIIAVLALLLMAIIADIFVMIYFTTFGWIGEIGYKGCIHGEFLVKALSSPWKPLFILFLKVYYLFNQGLNEEIEAVF